MKKIRKLCALFFVTVIVSAAMAQGCAVLGGAVAEKVAKGVEKYCEEPLTYRVLYRNTINSHLTATGHVVHVHCSGDPNSAPE